MQKKIHRKFSVLEIIVSELFVLNCLYWDDNACPWLSMCSQTVLGYCVSLKETISDATTLRVIDKFCKGAAIQMGTLFRPISRVLCLRVLSNMAF